MATLVQLQAEVWWRNEFVPPPLQKLIVDLREFYGVPAGNIGSKGDENHLRGYHRSRNWIKNSAYCTNRTYSVSETPGNRSGGNSDWLSAIDITIPRDELLQMCQRLDVGVRSGRFEKITEWYGNKDGDTRVDGYNNIRNEVASSDSSHLWHCHISFDRGAVGLDNHDDVFELLTGGVDVPLSDDKDFKALIERVQGLQGMEDPITFQIAGEPSPRNEANLLAQAVRDLQAKVEALITSGVPVPGAVNLTPESVQEVADAVVDEEQARLEN